MVHKSEASLAGGTLEAELHSANLDIDRAIELGPNTRIENGGTQASHTGASLVAGMNFGEEFHHGPFASLTWQKVQVDGYREESNYSTSMWFGDFERKSTVGRLGYQDYTRVGDIFAMLLKDEEGHVEWLESQLHQIKELGYETYLSNQTEGSKS